MFCQFPTWKKEFPPASGNPFFNQKTVMNLKEWFGFFFLSQEGNIHKIFRIRELENSKFSCWPKPSWRIVRSWYFLESLLDHGSDIQHLPPTFFLPNLKKSKNIQNLWIGEFDIVDVMNYRVFHVKVSESKPIFG